MFARGLLDAVSAGATNAPAQHATTQAITTSAPGVVVAFLGEVGAQVSGLSVSNAAGTGATWTLCTHTSPRAACAYTITSAAGNYAARFAWTSTAIPSETMIGGAK
jgi:hypothetical protein